MSARSLIVVLSLVGGCGAFIAPAPTRSRLHSSFAVVTGRSSTLRLQARPPWSAEELTCDKIDAAQVVALVLDAFVPDDEDWQFSNTYEEAGGSAYTGCRVLINFSAKQGVKVDRFGRLRPGAFGRAALLEQYLRRQPDYRTFTQLSEWRAVAAPLSLHGSAGGDSARRVTQKLLLRGESSSWEEASIDLELQDTPTGRRWLVLSIYKRDHDPAVATASSRDEEADPEESRNC